MYTVYIDYTCTVLYKQFYMSIYVCWYSSHASLPFPFFIPFVFLLCHLDMIDCMYLYKI